MRVNGNWSGWLNGYIDNFLELFPNQSVKKESGWLFCFGLRIPIHPRSVMVAECCYFHVLMSSLLRSISVTSHELTSRPNTVVDLYNLHRKLGSETFRSKGGVHKSRYLILAPGGKNRNNEDGRQKMLGCILTVYLMIAWPWFIVEYYIKKKLII